MKICTYSEQIWFQVKLETFVEERRHGIISERQFSDCSSIFTDTKCSYVRWVRRNALVLEGINDSGIPAYPYPISIVVTF